MSRLYAAAVHWLENVAAGRLMLPAAAVPAAPIQRDTLRIAGGGRVFTADELDGL